MTRPWLQRLWSFKTILLLLSGMIVIHFFVMLEFTEYSRNTELALSRAQLTDRMLSALDVIVQTPHAQRSNLLGKLVPTYMRDSNISEEAQCIQVKPHHLDQIIFELNKQTHTDTLCISYPLRDDQWLNLKGEISSPNTVLQWLLLSIEIIAASILLFAAWSIEQFHRPLKEFKDTAERLGVDFHSNLRLEISGPSVVRETAQAMNQMQQRIHDLIRDRTLMLAAISHDLRTPLTRLRLRTQQIDNDGLIRKMEADIEELNSMINQILAYAQIEFKEEEWTTIDLNSFLATLCDDLQDMGHSIQYELPNERFPIRAHSIGLKRAISNLLVNATKYAQHIEVHTQNAGNFVDVVILDDGPGIPEDDLKNVFRAFYRVDKARTQSGGSVGLGLSITQQIIEGHGGRISLSNRTPHGLKVHMQFPKHSAG